MGELAGILDVRSFADVIRDKPDVSYFAAMLTPNGQSSLIMTVPNGIWKDVGIDHDDPGNVNLFYFENENLVVMDFGNRKR